MNEEVLVALVVGLVQGIFEWLPVSSEGNVSIALTALGSTPSEAVKFALFLHAGTAVSATLYYRSELAGMLASVPEWEVSRPFGDRSAELSFLVTATVVSMLAGFGAYAVLDSVVEELSGAALVVGIGALLVGTGLLQRFATAGAGESRTQPTAVDAVLVGALQGLAILPGVSRSGTTVSALLLRGHEGSASFRLSFLLSIPAAFGAGVLVFLETGGLPNLSLGPAVLSLAVAAVVGYATIDALIRLVERVAFWLVCVGFGSLAIVGGALVVFA